MDVTVLHVDAATTNQGGPNVSQVFEGLLKYMVVRTWTEVEVETSQSEAMGQRPETTRMLWDAVGTARWFADKFSGSSAP